MFSSLKFCPPESERGSLTEKNFNLSRSADECGSFL